MIKKYLEFILESVHNNIYWLKKEEIKDIFQNIIDEGYIIHIDEVFMGYSGYSNGNLYYSTLCTFDINNDDVIFSGNKYFPAYRISIIIDTTINCKGDYTNDFKSAMSQLKGQDYITNLVVDDEDLKDTNIENIHLIDGGIITWVPESPRKKFPSNRDDIDYNDVYISSAQISILSHQSESIELNEVMLAEIYNWKCDRIEDGKIYIHVDIDDMARYLLSRNSYKQWGKILENNGEDLFDNYFSGDYTPDIDSIFQYSLNEENEILAIKCMIKEHSGLEEFIKECNKSELIGKSEDEVIDFLRKEAYHNTIKNLDSEIIREISEIISDWERSAHCDKNLEEIYEEFDELIEKENIEYTKIYKEIDKWYNSGSERKSYKENVLHYELRFDNRWIENFGKVSGDLKDVFAQWCNDQWFNYDLNPSFSDYGDVDNVALNVEIKSMLMYDLKSDK
jgi:hypothetical protein